MLDSAVTCNRKLGRPGRPGHVALPARGRLRPDGWSAQHCRMLALVDQGNFVPLLLAALCCSATRAVHPSTLMHHHSPTTPPPPQALRAVWCSTPSCPSSSCLHPGIT